MTVPNTACFAARLVALTPNALRVETDAGCITLHVSRHLAARHDLS
jgi:hypothetical protein